MQTTKRTDGDLHNSQANVQHRVQDGAQNGTQDGAQNGTKNDVPQNTRSKRIQSRWCKALCVLIAFVVADVVAGFSLGKYASLSSVAMQDFLDAPSVGTVFVGSSYAQRAFDPIAFDEKQTQLSQDSSVVSNSYNLSTPGETISMTRNAVDLAISRGAQRIVFGLGSQTVKVDVDNNADISYLLARYERDPLALSTALAQRAFSDGNVSNRTSLKMLTPWIYNMVRNGSAFASNLFSRLSGEQRGSAAQKVANNPQWTYVGCGYGNYTTLEVDTEKCHTTASVYGNPPVLDSCMEELAGIADDCKAAGVELIVVSTPHPCFDVLTSGDSYPQVMSKIQQTVVDHGGIYLDFNALKTSCPRAEYGGCHSAQGTDDYTSQLATDSLYTQSDFADFEHMSMSGARKFSRILASYLEKIEDHIDVSDDFYSYDEWDSWSAAHQDQVI